MSKAMIRRSEQLYSLLLQLYPKRYKQQFANEMQFVFVESLKEAYIDKGDQGIVIFWSRTFLDLAKSVATQHIENTKEGVAMKSTSISQESKKLDLRRPGLATLAILAIPLVARFPWNAADYIIGGGIIFATGFGIEFAWKKLDPRYRVFAILCILGIAFLIWTELAVDFVSKLLSGELLSRYGM